MRGSDMKTHVILGLVLVGALLGCNRQNNPNSPSPTTNTPPATSSMPPASSSTPPENTPPATPDNTGTQGNQSGTPSSPAP